MKRPAGQHIANVDVGRDLNQIAGDYHAAPEPVVLDYLAMVARIAPPRLLDRDAELAELAAFCTADDGPAYTWWRAPAWAGKSALLAWFVLHPPPGVRVISFFITARYSAQNDRTAFIDATIAQLSGLLGEQLPYLPDALREPHLFSLLERAAEACRDDGERLVLVVDGLDEDRSLASGLEHSIAALLPLHPPAGMRIVVAGRPNPPMPPDLHRGHPLRDQRTVRELERSRHAEADRYSCERDLRRLLAGVDGEATLLGLVAAAGGGLTAADLAALAGIPSEHVIRHLGTVAGRTFSGRPSRWMPEHGDVFVLAHEELQQQAVAVLGEEFGTHRLRIHGWAESYRARGWPVGTPEYLLRGYFRMLAAAGDVTRMIACATDPARHERLLRISGGDSRALSEIKDTHDHLVRATPLDLLTVARLAIHRQALAERNENIPLLLPAVWARLGQPSRAQALAGAISSPVQRGAAMAGVAEVLAEAGDHRSVHGFAHYLTDGEDQARVQVALVRALLVDGDVPAAEQAAQQIADAGAAVDALCAIALATRSSGPLDAAERHATGIADGFDRTRAISRIAVTLAATGDPDRAESVGLQFGAAAPSAAIAVAVALAGAGAPERAVRIANGVDDPEVRLQAQAGTAQALLLAGEPTVNALLLVRLAAATVEQVDTDANPWLLSQVARAAAHAGDHGVVARLAGLHPASRDAAMRGAALGAIDDGDLERGERYAADIADPAARARVLCELARACGDDSVRSHRFLADAEEAAWGTGDGFHQVVEVVNVADAAAAAGHRELAAELAADAEEAARSIRDSTGRVFLFGEVAAALAASREPERGADGWPADLRRADRLAATATASARELPRGPLRDAALSGAARATAAAGDLDGAEAVLAALGNPQDRTLALIEVIGAAAGAGTTERAVALARGVTGMFEPIWAWAALAVHGDKARAGEWDDAARHAAATVLLPETTPIIAGPLARTAAARGLGERAEQLVRCIVDPRTLPVDLAEVAGLLAGAGDRVRAAVLVADAEELAWHIPEPGRQAKAFAAVARALIDIGDDPRPPAGPGFRARRRVARAAAPPATERAALLTATALGLGDLVHPWQALAALDRHACRCIADDLLGG